MGGKKGPEAGELNPELRVSRTQDHSWGSGVSQSSNLEPTTFCVSFAKSLSLSESLLIPGITSKTTYFPYTDLFNHQVSCSRSHS